MLGIGNEQNVVLRLFNLKKNNVLWVFVNLISKQFDSMKKTVFFFELTEIESN